MSNLTTYAFNNSQIRVMEIDGQPWFVGSDVLTTLFGGSAGKGHLYDKLDSNEQTKVNRIHLGEKPGKQMVLVSESGLYKLIMRSDKPEARAFQDWVTKVVPAIRKDCAYVKGEEKVATSEMSEDELIATALASCIKSPEVHLLLEVARGIVRAELSIGERHLVALRDLVRADNCRNSEILPRLDNAVAVAPCANNLVRGAQRGNHLLFTHAKRKHVESGRL